MTIKLIEGCAAYLLHRNFSALTFAQQGAMNSYYNQYPGAWSDMMSMALYAVTWVVNKHRRTGRI